MLDAHRSLVFCNEDIAKTDLKDATIVYCASLCFPDELMKTLAQKLSHNKKVSFITMSELPEESGLFLHEVFSIPTSWSKRTIAYLYKNFPKK